MPTFIQPLRRLPQSLQFIAVGGAAAATHLLAVAVLVQGWVIPPLIANVLAFLLAFVVSYNGHATLTFAEQLAPTRRALPRYFFVACCSFALNELLYYIALNQLHWHYLWSLFVVLLIVAIITFVASKFWAFTKGAG